MYGYIDLSLTPNLIDIRWNIPSWRYPWRRNYSFAYIPEDNLTVKAEQDINNKCFIDPPAFYYDTSMALTYDGNPEHDAHMKRKKFFKN